MTKGYEDERDVNPKKKEARRNEMKLDEMK
jgi:hypothetical protein